MTNTPDTNQDASAHSPTPTALDKQVATLHELYGRLHENIEQFHAGWLTADQYSGRHWILSEAISEVRADGIDLVAYGLDPTIGSSNPPKSPDTPDQVDALDEILDATWGYGVDWTKFGDNPKKQTLYAATIKADMKKAMKAKLSALLVEAELNGLKLVMKRHAELEAEGKTTIPLLIVANRIAELEKQREATE